MLISSIRRFKPATILYNLIHAKNLRHNRLNYRNLGLDKAWYDTVSSADFAHLSQQTEEPEDPIQASIFDTLDPESQESLKHFDKNGFAILRNYLTEGNVNALNEEIDSLVANKKLSFIYRNKLLFAIRHSAMIKAVGKDPALMELIGILLNGEAALFQSINFIYGSEQATHSDAFHMSTYPLGGLLGAWFALEDIHPDNGPLHYYPGSHRLPYFNNADFHNQGSKYFKGKQSYPAYTAMLSQKIEDGGFKKEVFQARKGDLLLWHANLMHGGEPHQNRERTRKSMVFHYFKKGVVCYHEITQRPAIIEQF